MDAMVERTLLKRLLDACRQSLQTTGISLCVMVPLIFVVARIVAANGRPEPEQSAWSFGVRCFICTSLMIFSQIPVLFAANAAIAFYRQRLRIYLALLAGLILPFLDCLIVLVALPLIKPVPTAAFLLSILVLLPLLVSGLQLLPRRPFAHQTILAKQ